MDKETIEKVIEAEKNSMLITKIESVILEEITDNNNSGTAFINNNQNGMGNIVSPQP